jgi:hypothetical protein
LCAKLAEKLHHLFTEKISKRGINQEKGPDLKDLRAASGITDQEKERNVNPEITNLNQIISQVGHLSHVEDVVSDMNNHPQINHLIEEIEKIVGQPKNPDPTFIDLNALRNDIRNKIF